jgi:hypothetical protein
VQRRIIYSQRLAFIRQDWTNIEANSQYLIISEADDRQNVIYGRGSPEIDFRPVTSNYATKKKFEGSLPTSIFEENNISEVFGDKSWYWFHNLDDINNLLDFYEIIGANRWQ